MKRFNLLSVRTLCIVLSLLAAPLRAQETVSLLFAGDAMGHDPQFQWAYNPQTDTYNYEPNFRYVMPYINKSDLAIVNLEVTLGGKPYSGYPTFSTPDSYKDALVNCGFDVITLANNHILDRGKRGLERTLDKVADCPNVGAYRDSADRANRYPLILELQGLRIALFNVTYGTNGFFPVKPNIVNYIDTAQIAADLRSLEGKDIDMKIMSIHWGDEYVTKAIPRQRELARWLADKGFDLIIGGHPHVVEDAEYLTVTRARDNNKEQGPKSNEQTEEQGPKSNEQTQELKTVPVLYSLGNLISNQRRLNTNGGIMVRIDIRQDNAEIQNVSYLPCYVHKGTISYKKDAKTVTEKHFFLLPTTDYLDGKLPFKLDAEAEKALRIFHKNTTERLSNLPVMK